MSTHLPMVYRTVLFCTDFSANADAAFVYALDAATRSPESVLHLLHVIPEPEAQFWKTYLYEVSDVDARAREAIDRKVDESYRSRVPEDLVFRVDFRIGKDYMKILECAEEIAADLVVMGRQGCSSLSTVLFGNVTERVVRKAPCPVLVIPMVHEESGDTSGES